MPTYLQYEVQEVSPEKQAEYEAAVATLEEGADPPEPPEPEAATKTLTSVGEARLVVYEEGKGYQNLTLDLNGVSKVEVLADDPNAEPAPTTKSTKASTSSSS